MTEHEDTALAREILSVPAGQTAGDVELARQILSGSFDAAAQVGQRDLPVRPLTGTARFLVGQADTFEEKVKSFKKFFPEGDLQIVGERQPGKPARTEFVVGAPIPAPPVEFAEVPPSVKPRILWRPDLATPFAPVNPTVLEEFEPLRDLVDFFAGDIGAVAGAAALQLLELRRGRIRVRKEGDKLIPMMRRLFLGATGGETIAQALQSFAGIQAQTLGEIGGTAVFKGTVEAVAGGALRPLDIALRSLRGGSFLNLPPERQEVVQACWQLKSITTSTLGKLLNF